MAEPRITGIFPNSKPYEITTFSVLARPEPPGRRFKDLSGRKFGMLSVIAFAGMSFRHGSRWLCQCSCKAKSLVVTTGNAMLTGNTESCGCVQKGKLVDYSTTHGKSCSKIYKTWASMIRRCHKKNRKDYRYYGAKGIVVCERWRTFENFYADMGDVPENMSLERVDGNGNYCPENCVWADATTQMRNRSCVRKVEYKGQVKTLPEWAESIGVNPRTLYSRLFTRHMPIEMAFEMPVKNNGRRRDIAFGGTTRSVREWSRITGITRNTITGRIDRDGWTVEEALSIMPNPLTSRPRKKPRHAS